MTEPTACSRKAAFLDRDGVLVHDGGVLTTPSDISILAGVVEALTILKQSGYLLIAISNQTVVARGLLSEPEMLALERTLEERLQALGAPALDAFFYCPHHPHATDPAYRCSCACRKPEPGMLLRAAEIHGIDLRTSVMVGDRPTDVVAGHRAGCRTVWVHTGRHHDTAIVASHPYPEPVPDYTCPDLLHAATWLTQEVAA